MTRRAASPTISGMEETLEAGLAKIFGMATDKTMLTKEPSTVIVPVDISQEKLLQQANEAYDAAIRAQRDGDWTRYGEEIKKLGEILNKLR